MTSPETVHYGFYGYSHFITAFLMPSVLEALSGRKRRYNHAFLAVLDAVYICKVFLSRDALNFRTFTSAVSCLLRRVLIAMIIQFEMY